MESIGPPFVFGTLAEGVDIIYLSSTERNFQDTTAYWSIRASGLRPGRTLDAWEGSGSSWAAGWEELELPGDAEWAAFTPQEKGPHTGPPNLLPGLHSRTSRQQRRPHMLVLDSPFGFSEIRFWKTHLAFIPLSWGL